MRALIIVGAALLMTSGPLFAQQGERGYVSFSGGAAVSSDTTSGNIAGEAGVRVARNLFVFGNVGQFHNLQPSLVQPAIDTTTTLLSSDGVSVTGTARVPAWYSTGGLRYAMPTHGVAPYVLGSAGFARIMPSAAFTYNSGTLTDATPAPGDDVTSDLIAAGTFTQPAASTAFMFTAGAGVEVPVAPRFSVDVGYRFSRIAGDTPTNASSFVGGIGYRF